MRIKRVESRNIVRGESGVFQGLHSTPFVAFLVGQPIYSLTFRRHQRTCYSVHPFPKHIEALFVRKVKKIPLGTQQLIAIRARHIIMGAFVCYNSSKQNILLKDLEGEDRSNEREFFAH